MPAKATLIEVRSDWDWNMKWYGAPATNQTSGWLCAAKPGTWKALSKQERKDMSLTKAEWFENLASKNKTPNPIFHLPGVTNWTILPDWMHVADEGCGALAAGQILWEILSGYDHTNQECRVACLWEHINKIYEASNWPGEKKTTQAHSEGKNALKGCRVGCESCGMQALHPNLRNSDPRKWFPYRYKEAASHPQCCQILWKDVFSLGDRKPCQPS